MCCFSNVFASDQISKNSNLKGYGEILNSLNITNCSDSFNIYFGIDSSSSILYENFEKIKLWLFELAYEFDQRFGYDNVNIGLNDFSTNTTEFLNLFHHTYEEFNDTIKNLEYKDEGYTNFPKLLNDTKEAFLPYIGDTNFFLIFTDGIPCMPNHCPIFICPPESYPNVVVEYDYSKFFKENNIETIILEIGTNDIFSMVDCLVNDEKKNANVYYLKNYDVDKLYSMIPDILSHICYKTYYKDHYTISPTNLPSSNPTKNPTKGPTYNPSKNPTKAPTYIPTIDPTNIPTNNPTTDPTNSPSDNPTGDPTNIPSINPTIYPTIVPSNDPTIYPTISPTNDPSIDPTNNPSIDPTNNPSINPSNDPSIDPTNDPTNDPSIDPTNDPTNNPSIDPTNDPTNDPSIDPTNDPTKHPSNNPSNDPSIAPTNYPTNNPSIAPTNDPSNDPSKIPTNDPSNDPSKVPTNDPSNNPTNNPTTDPSAIPINDPSNNPSITPTNDPTYDPSTNPTLYPTNYPSLYPTVDPSIIPSFNPTLIPTNNPIVDPSKTPTNKPSSAPIINWTNYPSNNPIIKTTEKPSKSPVYSKIDKTYIPTFLTTDPRNTIIKSKYFNIKKCKNNINLLVLFNPSSSCYIDNDNFLTTFSNFYEYINFHELKNTIYTVCDDIKIMNISNIYNNKNECIGYNNIDLFLKSIHHKLDIKKNNFIILFNSYLGCSKIECPINNLYYENIKEDIFFIVVNNKIISSYNPFANDKRTKIYNTNLMNIDILENMFNSYICNDSISGKYENMKSQNSSVHNCSCKNHSNNNDCLNSNYEIFLILFLVMTSILVLVLLGLLISYFIKRKSKQVNRNIAYNIELFETESYFNE
ncbi:MAG: VWA domain-containing protein [Bacteroidetes bacterium]|nr:VWA domain-containing protein [Bacteroidota bacterium]